MKKKARYEFEAPESCAECDFRMFNECPTDGHVNEEYSDCRSPNCPLKIVPAQGCELCNKASILLITFSGKFVCGECWYGLARLHNERYGRKPAKPVLKPCPFCGEPKADGVTKIIPGYPDKSTPRYEIVCWKCFGRGPDYGTSAEAIAAWNRREG